MERRVGYEAFLFPIFFLFLFFVFLFFLFLGVFATLRLCVTLFYY